MLSLKDMCLIPRLTELAQMGIDSFKIEGRMKRPEYVAAAVTACRKALGGQNPELVPLQAVFSRSGFTSAYFDEKIGPDMFGFRRKEDVQAASGVLKELQETFRKDVPRIPAQMELSLKPGSPSCLTMTADGKTVQVSGDTPRESDTPANEALAGRFLGKLGGTPYYLDSVKVETEGNVSLPASGFNALRREAVEKLDAGPDAWDLRFREKSAPGAAAKAKAPNPTGVLGRIPDSRAAGSGQAGRV